MNPSEMTYEVTRTITPKEIYSGGANIKFDYEGWVCVGFWPPKKGECYKICNINHDDKPPEPHDGLYQFKQHEPRLIYVRDYSDSDIVDFVCSLVKRSHLFKLSGEVSRGDIKRLMRKEGWKSGE